MYKHTQYGTRVFLFIAVFAMVAGLPPFLSHTRNAGYVAAGVALLITIIAIAFSTLTIQVGDNTLAWGFTGGIMRKSVELKDIVSVSPTRTTLVDGIGVHLGPRGDVYNVALGDAVLVTMKNRKAFLLGSDEPAELANAIQSRIQKGT